MMSFSLSCRSEMNDEVEESTRIKEIKNGCGLPQNASPYIRL